MKNKTTGVQALLSFFAWIIIVSAGAAQLQMQTGIPAIITFSVLFVATVVLALFRASTPYNMCAVQVERWVPYIVERFWKNNKFLSYAWDDDNMVMTTPSGVQTVHIPQRGALPVVLKNNNIFPMTAVQRTDTDIVYNLDVYSTPPTVVPQEDLDTISYDKIGSVVDDHYGMLMQNVADDILYKWINGLPGTRLIPTIGAATAATISGQTNNRASMTYRELQIARLLLNKDNVPQEGRVAIIQSDMLDQMVSSLSNTEYRDFSKVYDPEKGTVGTLFGFQVIERSTTSTIQNALTGGNVTANDFETAVGATDNVACLCYQQNALTRAMGERKMFQREDDVFYQADIYSMYIRMGGARRRADCSGVVAITQAAA